jgi:hypothetical protein
MRAFRLHSNSRFGLIHHCAFSIVLCAFLICHSGFALSLRLHPLARLGIIKRTIQTSSLNRTFELLHIISSSFSCSLFIHISSPGLTTTALPAAPPMHEASMPPRITGGLYSSFLLSELRFSPRIGVFGGLVLLCMSRAYHILAMFPQACFEVGQQQ